MLETKPVTGILVIIIGLIFGSFLSVCVYRIPEGRYPKTFSIDPETGEEDYHGWEPAKEEDLMTPWYPPRSFCPHCKNQLLWWHNLPVVSWLILMGKCYFCKTAISPRYPLMEILSAGCAYLSYITYGSSPLLALIIYFFCAASLVSAFIDYDCYIIPDCITIYGAIIGIVLSVINHFYNFLPVPFNQTALECALGVVSIAGIMWGVALFYTWLRGIDGFGLGDVKQLAMIGAFFGLWGTVITIFIASVMGSVIGISLKLITNRSTQQHLPFGPALSAAIILYLFVSAEQLRDFQFWLARIAGV